LRYLLDRGRVLGVGQRGELIEVEACTGLPRSGIAFESRPGPRRIEGDNGVDKFVVRFLPQRERRQPVDGQLHARTAGRGGVEPVLAMGLRGQRRRGERLQIVDHIVKRIALVEIDHGTVRLMLTETCL